MNPLTLKLISDLLTILPQVILGVSSAVDTWKRGSELLQKMVDENREPTPEEWSEWQAGIDDVHNQIQNS